MALFDVYAGDPQGNKVLSLLFLFLFLNCWVYHFHFRTYCALNMTHFLLFLEQAQVKYPWDDKVLNMGFHEQ